MAQTVCWGQKKKTGAHCVVLASAYDDDDDCCSAVVRRCFWHFIIQLRIQNHGWVLGRMKVWQQRQVWVLIKIQLAFQLQLHGHTRAGSCQLQLKKQEKNLKQECLLLLFVVFVRHYALVCVCHASTLMGHYGPTTLQVKYAAICWLPAFS